MNHYTVEILINMYALGGSSDGIQIFDKNGKVVGYYRFAQSCSFCSRKERKIQIVLSGILSTS